MAVTPARQSELNCVQMTSVYHYKSIKHCRSQY